MKKMKIRSVLLSFAVCSLFCMMNAEETKAQSNWEVGIRFGQDIGIDATIPISARPRLHATAYFEDDFALGTYFDWMFALTDGPAGLKFYPGVGPEFYFGDDFELGIAGDFGMEYSFDFPLTVGFDWRPGFIVTNEMDFHSGNWGFMARFRFGEGTRFRRVD